MELERHLPRRAVRSRRRRAPRRLQARAGRAAAVGLPARALPARGRRLPRSRRRSAGGSCRRRSSREGPLGEGSFQLFVDADFEQHYFTLLRGRPDLHAALPAHLRLRPRRQQHRPQERPLPARARRPHLGHRQRAVLPRRVQAAHGDLGLRRRADARPRCWHDRAAWSSDDPRSTWPSCSTTTRPRRPATGRALLRDPACRSTRPAAATPGRWSRARLEPVRPVPASRRGSSQSQDAERSTAALIFSASADAVASATRSPWLPSTVSRELAGDDGPATAGASPCRCVRPSPHCGSARGRRRRRRRPDSAGGPLRGRSGAAARRWVSPLPNRRLMWRSRRTRNCQRNDSPSAPSRQ